MAVPISISPKTSESRVEIEAKLDAARVTHAKAILAGYELLQRLHDAKVLDALRGVIDGGDAIVTKLATAAGTEEPINAIRNLISMTKILGSIDPEILHNLAEEMSISKRRAANAPPPTLWGAIKTLLSRDSRHAIVGGAAFLQAFGRSLGKSSH